MKVTSNWNLNYNCRHNGKIYQNAPIQVGREQPSLVQRGTGIEILNSTVVVQCSNARCRSHGIFVGGLQLYPNTRLQISDTVFTGGKGQASGKGVEARRLIFAPSLPSDTVPAEVIVTANYFTSVHADQHAFFHAPDTTDTPSDGSNYYYLVSSSEGGTFTFERNTIVGLANGLKTQFPSIRNVVVVHVEAAAEGRQRGRATRAVGIGSERCRGRRGEKEPLKKRAARCWEKEKSARRGV